MSVARVSDYPVPFDIHFYLRLFLEHLRLPFQALVFRLVQRGTAVVSETKGSPSGKESCCSDSLLSTCCLQRPDWELEGEAEHLSSFMYSEVIRETVSLSHFLLTDLPKITPPAGSRTQVGAGCPHPGTVGTDLLRI